MVTEDRLLERLRQRKWAIGKWSDWYIFATPWFMLWIADPDGAWSVNSMEIVIGVQIWYKWNRNYKEGDTCWLREKRLDYYRVSIRELVEARRRS